MPNEPTNVERSLALHRHLSDNESECIKRNIIVRVDSINADHSVAQCSVEQRMSGLLRRTYPVPELIWRAEQALAPLMGLGIVPLLTIRHKTLKNTSTTKARRMDRSPMDRMADIWKWLGYPLSPEGFGAVVLAKDPFGWRQAMISSGRK